MATLQPRASVPFRFNGLPLAAIPHDEDLWLTGEDIGRALEYSDPRQSIKMIYTRNKDELDRYSTVLKLPVSSGAAVSDEGSDDPEEGVCGNRLIPQEGAAVSETPHAVSTQLRPVRVFSEEGVMILTMLSQQPRAAEFRAWAVGVLKAYRHGNLVIGNPANRERLLETCIKEARFGNGAALHTLIAHFGYPESIREPAPPASLPVKPPGVIGWFLDDYLPTLAAQVRAGSGPLFDDLRRRRPNFKAWREVKESGAAFALNHTAGDLWAIVSAQAMRAGIEPGLSASLFSRWLSEIEPDMNAQGWSRRLESNSQGRYVYRLLLAEGGAE